MAKQKIDNTRIVPNTLVAALCIGDHLVVNTEEGAVAGKLFAIKATKDDEKVALLIREDLANIKVEVDKRSRVFVAKGGAMHLFAATWQGQAKRAETLEGGDAIATPWGRGVVLEASHGRTTQVIVQGSEGWSRTLHFPRGTLVPMWEKTEANV